MHLLRPTTADRDERTVMKAYDVVPGTYATAVAAHRGGPPPQPAGWAGPAGPSIDPATWPRSPRTGRRLTASEAVRAVFVEPATGRCRCGGAGSSGPVSCSWCR
jgi:hypothetical protein